MAAMSSDDQKPSQNDADPAAALAMLAWQHAMGVDDAIAADPIDRYEASARRQAAPPPRSPERSAAPSGRTTTAAAALGGGAPKPAVAEDAVADARSMAQSCKTLEDLKTALSAFDGCALKKTATNLVFGDGNPEADVMFIGEAPGADEDRQGLPFVGVSGQMLDRMLGFIGLDRDNFYITNMLYWRPPGNRTPTDAEVATCLPFLAKHIQLVSPKVLVLVGGRSAKSLLQTSQGITKLRGRWSEVTLDGFEWPIPALPTLHPAYLLRNSAQKRYAWRDALILRERLDELGIALKSAG